MYRSDGGGRGRAAAEPSTPRPRGTTGPWPRRLAVALALAVLVVAAAGAVPSGRALVVADADSADRLLSVPVEDGTTVALVYTHSVEKTPVRDVYVVDGRRLVMTEMRFQSYGWGLPARADVETVDGWFVTHPDWSGRTLSVTPGRVADHRLQVGDRIYDLVALSDARTVRITVVRRSLLDRAVATLGHGPSAGAVPPADRSARVTSDGIAPAPAARTPPSIHSRTDVIRGSTH